MSIPHAILIPPSVGADPNLAVRFARHAEECGFESVVAVEHTVMVAASDSRYPYSRSGAVPLPAELDIPDPLDLLAFIAGATTTIGLATGVLVMPNHHPVVLAKRVATIDSLSAGRLRLVIGAGWMREEVEACGADFGSRGRRINESIDVMRTLWEPGPSSFDGEFFSFESVYSHPKPVQDGGVPIHIGGHSKAAARRAGRRGDGIQPLGVRGEELATLIDTMRTEAEQAGRDPDRLQLTVSNTLGRVDDRFLQEAEESGAARLMLAAEATEFDEVIAEMSAFAEGHLG